MYIVLGNFNSSEIIGLVKGNYKSSGLLIIAYGEYQLNEFLMRCLFTQLGDIYIAIYLANTLLLNTIHDASNVFLFSFFFFNFLGYNYAIDIKM